MALEKKAKSTVYFILDILLLNALEMPKKTLK